MKKTIIITLMLSLLTLNIVAQMRYNSLNGLLYSHPETADINQDEYSLLLESCALIEKTIRAYSANPSTKEMKKQSAIYLKAVGTKTALRLLDDLKGNYVYSSNGRKLYKIYT